MGLANMSIPAEFSIRGPEGTIPWVAVVNKTEGVEPMLIWAQDRTAAMILALAHHRGTSDEDVSIYGVTRRNHHLGAQRVVDLELAED